MMQFANSTFYMSGTEARLSPHNGSTTGPGGGNSSGGPSTATVHRLRKADSGRGIMTESRNSGSSVATAAEEEISPDETGGQSSSSAPISPTLSPSSRLMLKRKQLNASVALRSPLFSTSPSACSTSSSAASSLVSFGSSSKTNSLKRSSADENEHLASRLRNLQISELIDAIFLVEGKLKKEQKMIAKELRSRDLQISQQLKEIERYRKERKQNLCGFCQRKMENVCGGDKVAKTGVNSSDRVTDQRSVQSQTEDGLAFKEVLRSEHHLAPHGVDDGGGKKSNDEEIPDDDWYANGNSDNENEKSSPVNLYERGVNPVLERVNQILLQESMDASTEDAEAMMEAHVHQTAATAAPTTVVTKRVQFSTALLAPSTTTAAQLQQLRHHQHQVKVAERMQTTATTRIPEIRKVPPIGKCAPIPIVKQPLPPPVPSNNNQQHHHHPQPLIMRVPPSPNKKLENEYEVIGSEQDSSNYYMDMQSPDPKAYLLAQMNGSGNGSHADVDEVEYKNVLTRKEGLELLKLIAPHPGMPPALPPKPANLMKFKKVVPLVMRNIRAAQNAATGMPMGSDPKSVALEPDYCSISECGANNSTVSSSKSFVGPPRDHLDDLEETASKASEDTLENIPKLPNVAAIIVPKKHNSQSQQSAQQQSQAPANSSGGGAGNGNNNNGQNNVSGGGTGGGAINSNKSNNIVINKDNYITKTVMSLKTSSAAASSSYANSSTAAQPMTGLVSPKVKENIGISAAAVATVGLKDLPPISIGSGNDNNNKRFHSLSSSPMRASLNSSTTMAERRQNLIHRLSHDAQQHHGMMMKRYSMDTLSPQIQPEEVKVGGGLFEERIPIQAEFDWYNLDAEFGKFNAQDVIKETKSSGSESGGSVSGGDDEKRPAKVALERGLGELREIERKMSTIERKRANERSGNKEMVHFC